MSNDRIQELDALVSAMAIAEYRVRQLHKPKGWGEGMRCSLCVKHGDGVWPCMTLKALEPWRWDKEGKPRNE